jgi:hypothetical protein
MVIEGKSGNRYTFHGPFSYTGSIADASGVYAIIDSSINGSYLLDVGESGNVKTRLESHDRRPCWNAKRRGNIQYAVCYTPYQQQPGRMAVEQDIRANFSGLCGDR